MVCFFFVVKILLGDDIIFLDIFGYVVFIVLRERGVIVIDIIVLVVFADDGVMF